MTDRETMTAAYIEAVYFTDTGDCDQPPADAELTAACRARAHLDCRNFYRALTCEVWVYLPPLDWVQIGHDLWFTRNGHGVGFWSRPEIYGEVGAQWLTAMAIAAGVHDSEFEGEWE